VVSFALMLLMLAGTVVGLVMGLTGAGGGILAVPALVYSQGWTMQQAMPVALLAVTIGAMIGAVEGFTKNLVRYRAAFLMALAGSFPTWLGIRIAKHLSQTWLMGGFACVLLFVALRLYWQVRTHSSDDDHKKCLAQVNRNTGRFDWNIKSASVIASIGGLAGLSSGLLGVGGGFIIVPMLRHFTNISVHGAVATSLFVISLVGTMGVGMAVANGADLPLWSSVMFSVTTVIGTIVARKIAARLPTKVVQSVFILLLLGVAGSMLIRVIF